ncbi:hypothetical protein L1987_54826 [Smallanthus sonchifolius]|uniref:Uncharacterized protein n=1 Tax=Smallanthus sonchifolius TaxID=185202 RepID=A0ACB9E7P4_9ASTR|nr:hypothetical protein L1987_54826 [Smallanthus sonchifolius]
MPFGLCNAPATFQRCMMSIFSDMIGESMEVFMDDFSIFGTTFETCLNQLTKVLKRLVETNLVVSWEKRHFMVKKWVVLGHVISSNGIEVDHAKIQIISTLPPPNSVKGVRSFLGHAGFYRRLGLKIRVRAIEVIQGSVVDINDSRIKIKETVFIVLLHFCEVFPENQGIIAAWREKFSVSSKVLKFRMFSTFGAAGTPSSSLGSIPPEVTSSPCSKLCIDKVKMFKKENVDFSLSKVVDMLETQLHKPGNGSKGLGYNNVPPPFNGNCTIVPPPIEEQVKEFFMFTPGNLSSSDGSESSSSLASTVKCVKCSDASTSCAEKVEIEECNSENDEYEEACFCKNKINANLNCKNKNDTSKSTASKSNKPYVQAWKNGFTNSKLSAYSVGKTRFVKPVTDNIVKYSNRDLYKLKEKSKQVEKPMVSVHTSSASPKHFTKAEFYTKYDHHHKRFEQDHAQKNMTYASCSKRRCDQSYHSQSSSSPSSSSNRSGYVAYARKQTCYTCGKAGHIARHCMHRPYESYYMKNQRTTPRDRTYSKPMKANQPKAMKSHTPRVKPSDGDWNVAKRNRHAYFER